MLAALRFVFRYWLDIEDRSDDVLSPSDTKPYSVRLLMDKHPRPHLEHCALGWMSFRIVALDFLYYLLMGSFEILSC